MIEDSSEDEDVRGRDEEESRTLSSSSSSSSGRGGGAAAAIGSSTEDDDEGDRVPLKKHVKPQNHGGQVTHTSPKKAVSLPSPSSSDLAAKLLAESPLPPKKPGVVVVGGGGGSKRGSSSSLSKGKKKTKKPGVSSPSKPGSSSTEKVSKKAASSGDGRSMKPPWGKPPQSSASVSSKGRDDSVKKKKRPSEGEVGKAKKLKSDSGEKGSEENVEKRPYGDGETKSIKKKGPGESTAKKEKGVEGASAKKEKGAGEAATKKALVDTAPKPPKIKKKRKVSKEVEKEMRKAIRNEIRKRQTDAKSKVITAYKRELNSLGTRSSGDVQLPTGPPPDPTESLLAQFGPEQGYRLVSCWNFLYTFARPLGLLSVPTLPELCKALQTIQENEGVQGKHKEEAERILDDLCIALVRSVAPDLEVLLGLRGTGQSEVMEGLFSKKNGLYLPLNILTWKEIARQCLLMQIYAYFGFSDKDIWECMRGRMNPRRSRFILKFLNLRLENRMKMKPAVAAEAESESAAAIVAPTSSKAEPPSSTSTAADLEISAPSSDKANATAATNPITTTAMDVSSSEKSSTTHEVAPQAQQEGGASAAAVGEAPAPTIMKKEESGDSVLSMEPPPLILDSFGQMAKGESTDGALSEVGRDAEEDAKAATGNATEGEDEEEEEEEEEEEDEEAAKELEELLSSELVSNTEKRIACILKRLLLHPSSEKINGQGSQSRDVDSSLSEYILTMWQPLAVVNLVVKLKEGEYSGEDGLAKLARHVNLLCRNSWSCNMEDSEGWSAAEKLQAIFDRLLKTWILDSDRPPLNALQDEACGVCGYTVQKSDLKITCGRCSVSHHSRCHPASQSPGPSDDVWGCNDCVNMTVQHHDYPKLGVTMNDETIPDFVLQELGRMSPEVRPMLGWMKMVVDEWGPQMAYPPILDITINRTVLDFVKADHDLFGMLAAVALLAGHGSSHEGKGSQRLVLLDALCQVAATSQSIRSFLDKQDHKISSLRRKLPEDEGVLRMELKIIGGDAAVLAWKDPMYGGHDEAAGEEEGEEEEEQETSMCIQCKSTTQDVDDSQVVLCENCPTEIHLRCLDPSAEKVPEKAWFCPRCRAKKVKKRIRHTLKGDELEDLLEDERQVMENALMDCLVDRKIDERVMAEEGEAGEAAAKDSSAEGKEGEESKSAKSASPSEERKASLSKPSKPLCEYCGYTELDLCSPLVLGQTPEETEEHMKIYPTHEAWVQEHLKKKAKKSASKVTSAEAGASGSKQGEGDVEQETRATLVPYFPRQGSAESGRFPTGINYPLVHEKCAVQMLSLRAKALRDKNEGVKEQKDEKERIVEEAVKISGTRTYPLGEDRHGRSYWKMPGDDSRLFVWIRENDAASKENGGPPQFQTGLVPGGRGRWLCYEKAADIKSLCIYLDSRSPREAALKTALKHEYLEEHKTRPRKRRDESIIIRRRADTAATHADSLMEITSEGGKAADEAVTEHKIDEDERKKEEEAVSQEKFDGEMVTAMEEGTGVEVKGHGDSTESEGVPAAEEEALKEEKNAVALKIIAEKCQVDVPPEVIEIEVDPDLWGEQLEAKAAVRRTRKNYALALVDKYDEIYENRNVGIRFEIFRGGDSLEKSEAPRAHKDYIHWFYHYEFLLPGIYTLRFSVMTESLSEEIRPLCLRVDVRARRAATNARSVLNELSFLNISRGGRWSARHSLELDIPDDADEVTALRIALLQLKETLPAGSLIESEEDLAGTSGGRSSPSAGGSSSGSSLKAPPCYWTDAIEAHWVDHLMEAKTAQEVMEDLVLLESCIHQDWLKPWYQSMRRAYASSPSHLLRQGTLATTALHLFVLDKALMYDKEKKVPRKTRAVGRNTQQVIVKPHRRMTQRSRLAELSDEYDEASEEEESESEEEYNSDDSRKRTRRASKPQKKKGPGRPPGRASQRTRGGTASYHANGDDGSDFGIDDFTSGGYGGGRLRHTARVNYRELTEFVDEEEAEMNGGGGEEESDGEGDDAPVFVKECLHVIKLMRSHRDSYLFEKPVDETQAPAYYSIVNNPMCLSELRGNVKSGKYEGSVDRFTEDARKIWQNSVLYNGAEHTVTVMANEMKNIFEKWMRSRG